jgi:hypothetical protein
MNFAIIDLSKIAKKKKKVGPISSLGSHYFNTNLSTLWFKKSKKQAIRAYFGALN